MPHALAIFSYSAADKHHVEVKFLGDRPKKPVYIDNALRINIKNDTNYEPETGIGADTTITGLKIAAEVANIDTSSVRCVHLKHTPGWNDENIEVEKDNDSPVYVLHTSGENENKEFDRWIAIATIRQIEGNRDNPRRFAILFYDDGEASFNREKFELAWTPSVQQFVVIGNKQVFDALEARKFQEYKQKREEAALKREERKKRSRFFGALARLLLGPHFLGFVSVLTLVIGCVWASLNPEFLFPVTSGAAAPVLMAILGISVFAIFVGSVIYGLALLIGDYHLRKDRMFLLRQNYDALNYFTDWPTRIRNWHKDCPLQAAFFYVGLIVSAAFALAVLIFGIHTPLLNFVAEIVKSGFQALGFASIAPDGGFFALHVFTAVITTLAPLALGAFAMQFVWFLEEGVLPSRDKEIAETNLSEDRSTLTVRFRDGLSAELSIQNDLEPAINVSKVGYSKYHLFLLDEADEKQHTKSSAELHDALEYSRGKYRVNVV